MTAAPGDDAPLHASVDRVHHGEIVGSHVGDQHLSVVPQHARRRAADRRGPAQLHGAKVDGRQSIAALEAHEHHRTVRRVRQMAGHRGDREAVNELQRGAVVDVDLVAQQAVDGEVFAVRTEAELVRISHGKAAKQRESRRVVVQQLVGPAVADQQAAPVRSQRPVMRLAQHRDAADFLHGGGVDHRQRRAGGVHHQHRAGAGGGGACECRQQHEAEREPCVHRHLIERPVPLAYPGERAAARVGWSRPALPRAIFGQPRRSATPPAMARRDGMTIA